MDQNLRENYFVLYNYLIIVCNYISGINYAIRSLLVYKYTYYQQTDHFQLLKTTQYRKTPYVFFSTLYLSEFVINWIYFKRKDFKHCILGYPSDCFVNFSWESSLDTTLTVITCYNGVSISNTHYWCLVIVVVYLSNLGSFQQ